MSLPSPPPAGVYTPIPTFFKKDGYAIDYDAIVAHCQFLHKAGIQGAAIHGSTGEGVHLTRTERVEVIKRVRAALPADFVILGGVVQNSLQEALDEVEALKSAGAAYALTLGSNYFGLAIKQQGIIDWFTSFADKSALPVLLYVYPGVSNGLSLSPETIIHLSAHKNIVGCKISHGDVSHHTLIGLSPEIQKNNFLPLTGLGQLLLPVLTVGFKGTVDAISGAFPKIYVKVFNLFQEGKIDEARKYQLVISRAEEIVVKSGVIGIKTAIHKATGFGESVLGRAPLNQDVDAGAWASTLGYFDAITEVENSL
ncbi:unnamed protein product [Kuraishia capsulata CBS 1993]|uniref:4-hydroxy-2-oxoglutarate aldolase, mitochondrial n=1 Tax=Kuraishia capsulata CBS 1993 TaxID=1382522 RepID=W6MPR8_9ASCO|nr:uncharacterized protein KUCA_T00004625001 [Kuraishia capsulata CBS 1993]CDK28641.1 unnamed protein product [Kuraishia capsulata CBS 1993]